MKTPSVQILIIVFVLLSCSKTENVPNPSVNMIIGTRTTGIMVSFVPFKSQDTIEYSQLDTIDLMRIKITEMHLDSSYFVGTERKPVFSVDINTSSDREHYLSGSNCWLCGWGGGTNAKNIDCTIMGELEFPIKISKKATPNNDTIEFNDENDYILITYKSVYTKMMARDSLLIYKNN